MPAIAVKSWVFNPKLKSKIVIVSGRDSEGNETYIRGAVTDIHGDKLIVKSIDNDTESTIYLHDFHDEGLKISVWDGTPTEYEMPESYSD
ncbi:hypothetical protein [Paenibacillus woosongensis]|uniref:Uncharacterized protein n=1 Tax=Paenibacillus woosongensis TaxID=307580 RepID=A0ABQ4MZ33_9BACL|nr:hypothetical protein [Paenibacillus woosongensis]GIP61156.1 hypothetical protein J15TS10_49700 [Paenibacillus woosongensis]